MWISGKYQTHSPLESSLSEFFFFIKKVFLMEFYGSSEGSRMGAVAEDLVHHRDNEGKNFSFCYSHQVLECQVTLNLPVVLVGHDNFQQGKQEKRGH